MQQTSNYNMNKPAQTDVIDIDDLNANFDTLDAELKKVSDKANLIQTAGGTATVITLNNVSMVNGFTIAFIVAANNNGAATTINGKALYKPGGTTAPKLIAGKAVTVWYNGTNFFIKASAEGDAIAGNVLAGKTFSNDGDTGLVGTMPNNGPSVAETINLTTGGAEYTIPAGYHSGLRKVKAVITNLIASVIKAGTTVGGVLGTFTADATALASHILAGKSAYVNGVKVSGSMNEYSGQTLPVVYHLDAMTVKVDPADNRMGIVTLPNTRYNQDGHISNTTKLEAQLWGLIPSAIAAGAVVGQWPGAGAGNMIGTFSADASIEPHLMVAPYSAYKNGVKVVGTMPSMGSEEHLGWRRGTIHTPPQIWGRLHARIPLGAYLVGAGEQEGQLGVFVDDPDFIPANILDTANIFGLQGSIIKRSSDGNGYHNIVSHSHLAWGAPGRLHYPIYQGAYFDFDTTIKNTGIPMGYIDDPDFISANILNTANIFGMQGTAVAGKRYASGTAAAGQTYLFDRNLEDYGIWLPSIAVSGLNFKASTIVVRMTPHHDPLHPIIYTKNSTNPGRRTILMCTTNNNEWLQINDREYNTAWGRDKVAHVSETGFILPVIADGVNYAWEAYE